MNPAVFQPGGPGGEEEEEEEGSFHTRISHPHPTFSYLLVYAEHGILQVSGHIRHFNSFGCFVSSSHITRTGWTGLYPAGGMKSVE